MEEKISPLQIEVNTAYLLSQACDLILRDAAKRLESQRASFKRETKQKFSRWIEAVKRACILNEDLCEDIYKNAEKRNYKDVQIWQEQENEMARFVLLLADRSRNVDSINAVFKTLRSLPGEGVITEDVLKNFYLKKL